MCQNIENYFTNDQNLSEENLTMKTNSCQQRKDVDYALYLGQNSSKHHLIVLSVFSRCLCQTGGGVVVRTIFSSGKKTV